ncbi:hypothetical protein [aff. Roholtiella sp. LEGE 12411]|nr:hypothetical protein [aff. Roholtiella sp. LEGE 12411]
MILVSYLLQNPFNQVSPAYWFDAIAIIVSQYSRIYTSTMLLFA